MRTFLESRDTRSEAWKVAIREYAPRVRELRCLGIDALIRVERIGDTSVYGIYLVSRAASSPPPEAARGLAR